MKKASDFFDASEKEYLIRQSRIVAGLQILRKEGAGLTKKDWSRMVSACIQFYKDALLIENYALLHLSGFSKILKSTTKLLGNLESGVYRAVTIEIITEGLTDGFT